ncbi:hypothetical protein RCO27_00840 [Sphingosinicella sp. LHD-64]|nr:hypothetical protein [Sphingosinicella sp. LHD-64]MDQ8754762.1 hypothetical protein [Sphingosinicella sp. LHD-64]
MSIWEAFTEWLVDRLPRRLTVGCGALVMAVIVISMIWNAKWW